MSPASRACTVLASVLLAAAVLGTVPDASRAQERAGGNATARILERPSEAMAAAQMRRARQHRQLQRLGTEQARAHARMPDTLYASTPDPSPPHPFLLDAGAESTPERSAGVSARSAARLGYRLGLFPSALRWRGEKGYQGFVRVVNRSDEAGEVRIDAWDDAGKPAGPVTLAIRAGETKHFNSEDLEEGAEDKGLSEGIGSGEGDWRLELSSTLDVEVLGYIRTKDGFLTAMHDVAPSGESGHRVVTLNPGRNVNQVSRLRVVNPGAEAAQVRIEGTDDAGASSDGAVEFTLAPGASRMFTAKELESGEAQGLSGALGTGAGKWRLRVTSVQPVEVMSLLSSPTGHLTNLSTVPDATGSVDAGVAAHGVALFPSASDAQGRQGFVRVVNRTDHAGEVRIDAWDDEGVQADGVRLAIGAGETKHFNSDDLETGNAEKGLEGATGSGAGDWRLELTSGLDIEVLAYIRTEDGFLTAMHDVAPSGGAGHRVVTFNPGRNVNQVSWLRVVNPGAGRAEVIIEGVDDKGASPGGAVELTLGPGASRTLSARELESGGAEGLSGALGAGTGKWRLAVTSDRPVQVMSLLSSPTGHLTNLSTLPHRMALGVEETAEEVFREDISGPIVQGKCIACHVDGGVSGNTRLVFVRASQPEHEARNLRTFETFLADVDDGASLILNKIQGVAHGGGAPVPAGTQEFADMERFLRLLGEDVSTAPVTVETLFDTVTMAPLRKTLRRAALIFAGRIPTDEEYAAVQRGGAAAREAIRGLMTGPQFHEFLIRGANDRLLTDRDIGAIIDSVGYFVDFTNENYRRRKAALASGTGRALSDHYDWWDSVQYGARRASLELIAHVAENDLPYTEILTADYIMANSWAAEAYGAPTHHFDDPADGHEFKPSRIVSYYRHGPGFEKEYDPVVGADRVLNPGPLRTDYPHAGILNTKVFLERYPTTATNRNRARSRWTYYHFLGLDIEKSASRTTDPVALADTNNPTLRNPACTVCHRIMDPVAGAFQNYGDEGLYKDQWPGLDSLDHFYKLAGEERNVRADSWEDREALSWSVFLGAGVQTLRVLYANDYYDPDTGDDGYIYLDRLRVRDAHGGVLVSPEFEDLGPPMPPPGSDFGCGHEGYNPAGRYDHVRLFNGGIECAFFIDVEVPRDGVYDIEVVAWMNGRHELYGEDGFAKLSVMANAYKTGDTWYRDMRTPGFDGKLAPNPDNSVQWLAKKIVADKRFAEATVKFWWPAIMGSEVAEPPEDEGDADFEGLLLAANAQGAEVTRLANGFRRGFRGRATYNLKDLLVEMVLSSWFRADAVEDDHPVRSVALRDAGARRLLTPEELDRKTAALTGLRWGWWPRISGAYRGPDSRLTDAYRLLYGGIDSDGVTERARDLTSVMAGVAKRHAVQVSCSVVRRELYLLPETDRRLFAGIDRLVTPALEFGATFEVEAGSRSDRETLSLDGRLTAGPKTVRLAFTNDYWGGETADRNVHLDRLVVRNTAGRMVVRRELEELGSQGDCCTPNGDNFALWGGGGALEVPVEVPSAGSYTIEVVAWADQAGDELPRLSVVVESDAGGSAGESAIRSKLVELYDELLGVQVTPHSPDVEAAYRLFVEVMDLGRRSERHDWLELWRCDRGLPLDYFEGILDDSVVEREDDGGWRWYDIDWDRVDDFARSINWSDPHHTAQAWVVVLASLLMDYRYLYL